MAEFSHKRSFTVSISIAQAPLIVQYFLKVHRLFSLIGRIIRLFSAIALVFLLLKV